MPDIRVHQASITADGYWRFDDSSLTWRPPNHRLGHQAAFDPFPAYPHDLATVTVAAGQAQTQVPPLWDVDLFVCDREETSRMNGYSHLVEDGRYEDGGKWVKEAPSGVIVLSAKRVQPHPAMTRYLVAHEYGHNVAYMLNSLRGDGDSKYVSMCEPMYAEYAKVRGLPDSALHAGNGGTWHDSAAEIFACDFRTVVLAVEPEFWPHPGIPEPHTVPGVAAWWADAITRLRGALAKAA